MDPSSTIVLQKPKLSGRTHSSSSSSTYPAVDAPTGADVLSALSLQELAQIFKKYGEEKNNKSLANLLYDTKYAFGPIETTGDLVKVISSHAYKEYQSDREFATTQKKQTLNVLRSLRLVDCLRKFDEIKRFRNELLSKKKKQFHHLRT